MFASDGRKTYGTVGRRCEQNVPRAGARKLQELLGEIDRLMGAKYKRLSCEASTKLAGEGKVANWRETYTLAAVENNPKKVKQLVQQSEQFMLRQLRELKSRPDGENERLEIQQALEGLLDLKAEKLGWPDPRHPR